MNAKEKFAAFRNRFRQLTDQEVIDRFNEETGKQGLGEARASYLAAIHAEFDDRGFDYVTIGGVGSLSFRNRVRLDGKIVVPQR